MPLFKTILEVGPNTDLIRKRAYGMIEVTDQRLVAIHFRPWPKLISTVEALWICLLYTSPSPRDRQKSRMPSSA